MGWESSGVVGFDLGPLLEGQMRTAKLKSAYNLLIIGSRGFGALSLWWIQFASVFRCARSSCNQFCFVFLSCRSVLLSVHLVALIIQKLQHQSSLNFVDRFFPGQTRVPIFNFAKSE